MEIIIQGIPVTIERKKIKNMYLYVLSPDGRVKVTAPKSMNMDMIRKFVTDKITWIRKKQEKYRKAESKGGVDASGRVNGSQENKKQETAYTSGDLIPLWGKRYRLEVVPRNSSGSKRGCSREIFLSGEALVLYVKETDSTEQRACCINEWYRAQLKSEIPGLIEKWEKIIGVHVREWGVKNMKTRWGTCNVSAGRIWLNLQLAKYKPECLEYVVVHEMTHLLERGHNKRFYGFMDRFLPEWRRIKKEMNQL